MDIPAELDERLTRHLRTPGGDQPPIAVYRVLERLASLEDIKASVRSFEWSFDLLTTWSAHFVTSTALVVAAVEFEAERYTRALEEEYRESDPTWRVREAWVRTLRSIRRYALGGGGEGLRAEIHIDGVDQPMPIPGLKVDQADGSRSDDFVRALRDQLDWLR